MNNLDRPKHESDKRDKMNNPNWNKYSGWPPADVKDEKPRRKQRDEKPAEDASE